MLTDCQSRALLSRLFKAALAAVDPRLCLPPALAGIAAPRGRTLVVGAGKAAASMAQALEAHWPGQLEGLVVTRYGHGLPCARIEVIEAGHPLPDAAGAAAAARTLALVSGLGREDLVIALMSGGGSALLAAPAPGVSLIDKQDIHRALLASGAAIDEINCVRRHLSAIKGGRLARALQPARLVTLVLSDVPGDDPAVVASGPTIADASTCAEALDILDRYAIPVPQGVRQRLRGGDLETPKPGSLAGGEVRLIATARQALAAAAAEARAAGFTPLVLGDRIEGEAREVARVLAGIAQACADLGQPAAPPCALLSGGETTVRVQGGGRGGRNSEFLLALALALGAAPGIHALACDTDGIDGSEDNAGALLAPDTLARARRLGLDARARLRDNDAHGFFSALGDLVITGPTRTNVNDFRAILVGAGTAG